jgi:hypothetical protein
MTAVMAATWDEAEGEREEEEEERGCLPSIAAVV